MIEKVHLVIKLVVYAINHLEQVLRERERDGGSDLKGKEEKYLEMIKKPPKAKQNGHPQTPAIQVHRMIPHNRPTCLCDLLTPRQRANASVINTIPNVEGNSAIHTQLP